MAENSESPWHKTCNKLVENRFLPIPKTKSKMMEFIYIDRERVLVNKQACIQKQATSERQTVHLYKKTMHNGQAIKRKLKQLAMKNI